MPIEVRVYDNGDHTAIMWLPDGNQPIKGCLGFTIKRKSAGQESFIHGSLGFSDGEKFPAKGQEWKWPVQRFIWWDYGVTSGDVVSYQVIPVTGTKDNLALDTAGQSAWTDNMTVTGQSSPSISAFFNKGIVAAQWVSRDLDKEAPGTNKQTALKTILQKPGDPLRDALGGLLKKQILSLLAEAKTSGQEVFAALYELNDPDLLVAIKALGKSMHLILANGAFSAQEPDENAKVRADLKPIVDLHDRLVPLGHFAHNKFVVFCDKNKKPQKVLTGSTNWTWSGICSQANNGLVVSDAAVAQAYLDEWNRLLAAKNAFPPDLAAQNSQLRQFKVDDAQVTTWFAPTNKEQDLDYARKLIANAQDGILFLFFNPGVYSEDAEKETLLQDVVQRHNPQSKDYNANLYIKGVVNQEIQNLTGGDIKRPPVQLVGGDTQNKLQPLPKDVLTPANIKAKFHNFEDETLRATMVMVHSKVVILDPFGKHPVVMTGSHNLGLKASSKNDDNLIILEGPAAGPLAAAYALNIIAIYQTYRWNSYATANAKNAQAFHALSADDTWQQGHLEKDALAELEFWMASQLDQPAAAAAVASPAAAHAPAKPHSTIRRSKSKK